jgi:hypothetical protein
MKASYDEMMASMKAGNEEIMTRLELGMDAWIEKTGLAASVSL